MMAAVQISRQLGSLNFYIGRAYIAARYVLRKVLEIAPQKLASPLNDELEGSDSAHLQNALYLPPIA